MKPATGYTFDPPFYPIVYVRGYAMRREDIEETFYDSYYGFATSAVYKKQTDAGNGYLVPDLFEGQLIRFMKSRFESADDKPYGYADVINSDSSYFEHLNPSRSIWISRFYDVDYIQDKVRSIENHALELTDLIVNIIPKQLVALGMNPDVVKTDYKVILIAHSMGGLVCRTMIQNSLPNFVAKEGKEAPIIPLDHIKNPELLIHRFVTIGTPHKGIDMGNIPDVLENAITAAINPYDSNIFKPRRMREYLKLTGLKEGADQDHVKEEDYKFDIHSLGNSSFPIKKCLCIIGSDYSHYSGVKYATGSFSDGLVKQDRAYVVSGERPEGNNPYEEKNTAFYANVHRAHSGFHGIVNSYETFENIQRFLFGDLRVRIALDNVKIQTQKLQDHDYFYDFEFSLTIRGTGVYLHQRKQDPCENAIRLKRNEVGGKELFLHNGFLNSKLCQSKDTGSHFIMKFSVLEYRTKQGWLWDTQYPSRTIYSESLEVRIKYNKGEIPNYTAQYSWQSDTENWNDFDFNPNGDFVINLATNVVLAAKANVTGNIVIRAFDWTVG